MRPGDTHPPKPLHGVRRVWQGFEIVDDDQELIARVQVGHMPRELSFPQGTARTKIEIELLGHVSQ